MKSFGDIFKESWKEFKLNFKLSSKLIFYFIFIPSILLAILSYFLFLRTDINQYISLSIVSILGFIVLFIGIIASTSIYASALFGKKKYDSALAKGKGFYWRYIGFNIVFLFFLLILYLLFIIPGIIFTVFWVFAIYIFLLDDKGILDSMKASKRLVKGKWWMVFGYSILFGLITLLISMIFSIPSWPTAILVFLDAVKNPSLYAEGVAPPTIALVHEYIGDFLDLLSKFVTLPLTIIFFKNFYLSMKKK